MVECSSVGRVQYGRRFESGHSTVTLESDDMPENDNDELPAVTLEPPVRIKSSDMQLDPSQDWEALFNIREWLRNALNKAGAKDTGSGIGCGGADISIILEGCPYHVAITPIIPTNNRTEKAE